MGISIIMGPSKSTSQYVIIKILFTNATSVGIIIGSSDFSERIFTRLFFFFLYFGMFTSKIIIYTLYNMHIAKHVEYAYIKSDKFRTISMNSHEYNLTPIVSTPAELRGIYNTVYITISSSNPLQKIDHIVIQDIINHLRNNNINLLIVTLIN